MIVIECIRYKYFVIPVVIICAKEELKEATMLSLPINPKDFPYLDHISCAVLTVVSMIDSSVLVFNV